MISNETMNPNDFPTGRKKKCFEYIGYRNT